MPRVQSECPTAGFGTRLLSLELLSPSSADGHLLPSLLPCGRCCPPCLTSLFHKNDLLCHILQLFQPFVWEITFPFPSPTKLHLKPVVNGPKQSSPGRRREGGLLEGCTWWGISLVLLLFPFQAGGWELVIRESDGIEIFNLLALLAACYIIN